MDLGLKGKRVLVTGGTKSIGRAIVDAFVAEGAIVGFCAREPKLVKEREQAWRSSQARVSGTALDVTDDAALKKWIDGFADDGGLDHFVANVSALGIEDTEASWRSSIAIPATTSSSSRQPTASTRARRWSWRGSDGARPKCRRSAGRSTTRPTRAPRSSTSPGRARCWASSPPATGAGWWRRLAALRGARRRNLGCGHAPGLSGAATRSVGGHPVANLRALAHHEEPDRP